jgi:hypothetical protein
MGLNRSAMDIATINVEDKAREQIADAGDIVVTAADFVPIVSSVPAFAAVQVLGDCICCKS